MLVLGSGGGSYLLYHDYHEIGKKKGGDSMNQKKKNKILSLSVEDLIANNSSVRSFFIFSFYKTITQTLLLSFTFFQETLNLLNSLCYHLKFRIQNG